MPILTADNVFFSYDKKRNVVSGVSFYVEKGEHVAVIGHNGSGKSTLAKLFNGLLIPDKGKITVDGFTSADAKSLFEIRKRVGVVFQNPDNQLVASIVEDDVAFGPENLGVPRAEIGERINFALKAVEMESFRRSSPERLSGGQKQRIAIAGVLALKPEIIVFDESTSMLDPKGREEVLSVSEKLKNDGVAVISITHYMEEAVRADRIYVINEGKVLLTGTPQEIFAHKNVLIEAGLEIPAAARIAEKLKNKGVPLPDGILTDQRLKEELCKLTYGI
ncbi:MAG: energy-coupling factor transporter ATPase [Clostridia bacterium]|nr:energy-coupling factor transporter ATPase [Clostridia bacterium]